MRAKYQARWISKNQLNSLRRKGALNQGVLVNHFKGFVIVEPVGSRLAKQTTGADHASLFVRCARGGGPECVAKRLVQVVFARRRWCF